MQDNWKTFLEQQDAIIEDNCVTGFDSTPSAIDATMNFLCELSYLSGLKVSGDDAQSFLQNQTSNDIALLDASHWQFNSYNSPKGRMYASFCIFQHQNDYFIHLPNEIIHPTQQRLSMFILRSKVQLDNVADQYVSFGISGPDAASILASANIDVPAAIHDLTSQPDFCTLRLPGSPDRFMLFGQPAPLQALWEKWRPDLSLAGANAWRLFNIRAGIPSIFTTTRETFVPQMVNFQAINGISLTKGCYPGQEIVARMHYLGNLKKSMFLTQIAAHIDNDPLPQPGDKLYSSEAETSQSIGNIVDAQWSHQQQIEALCVIQIKSADTTGIHLYNSSGPKLTLKPLPYALATSA